MTYTIYRLAPYHATMTSRAHGSTPGDALQQAHLAHPALYREGHVFLVARDTGNIDCDAEAIFTIEAPPPPAPSVVARPCRVGRTP